jgi:hypothetical protein
MNVVWKWTGNRQKSLVVTVHRITSGEIGGTITLIAGCSAEGNFVSSYFIFKGKRKKNEFEEGSHLVSEWRWMKLLRTWQQSCWVWTGWDSHSISRKESGSVQLQLDGHRSHCSEVNVLDFATESDVILLFLPSHSTHHLQPLGRFFKPLRHSGSRLWTTGYTAIQVGK